MSLSMDDVKAKFVQQVQPTIVEKLEDADFWDDLNVATITTMVKQETLKSYVMEVCDELTSGQAIIVTSTLSSLVTPSGTNPSPARTVSDLSSGGMSRDRMPVSPRSPEKSDSRKESDLLVTDRSLQPSLTTVWPMSGASSLDPAGTAPNQKIAKGPNSGQKNGLLTGIDGMLMRADRKTVTVQLNRMTREVQTFLMPAASGIKVILDNSSEFVSHVASQTRGLLSTDFDRVPELTVTLSMGTSPSNSVRFLKVKTFEMVAPVPKCLEKTLVNRMSSFLASQDKSSRYAKHERDFSNVAELTQDKTREQKAPGFLLLVHGDGAIDMQDRELLDSLEADFLGKDYFVLKKPWSDLEELPSGVAEEVTVVLFAPSSHEQIFIDKSKYDAWFMDYDGTGKKFENAIIIPGAHVMNAAVFEQYAVPEDTIIFNPVEGLDRNMGCGDLRISFIGPEVLFADFQPNEDDKSMDPRDPDPSVLSVFANKPDRIEVFIPMTKYVNDRADAYLFGEESTALQFIQSQWSLLQQKSGGMPGLTLGDIATLTGSSGTSVGPYVNGSMTSVKKKANDTRGSPSVARKLLIGAVAAEALPRTPFATFSWAKIEQLSLMKKSNKKPKVEDGHTISSSSSGSSDNLPKWNFTQDEKNYKYALVKQKPGAKATDKVFVERHVEVLLDRHFFDEEGHTSAELEQKLAAEGDPKTIRASCTRAFKYWWEGCDPKKGVPLRLAACRCPQPPKTLRCDLKRCDNCKEQKKKTASTDIDDMIDDTEPTE